MDRAKTRVLEQAILTHSNKTRWEMNELLQQLTNYNQFLLLFLTAALYLRNLQQKLERNKCPIQKTDGYLTINLDHRPNDDPQTASRGFMHDYEVIPIKR